MAKLTFEQFVKKYIIEVTGEDLPKVLEGELGQDDLPIIESILNTISQDFYQDYLNGKLDFIDKEDDPNEITIPKILDTMEKTNIVVLEKGPVLIEGKLLVTHPNGTTEEKEKVALCRCGYSKNKPYCDGAHRDCPVTQEL